MIRPATRRVFLLGTAAGLLVPLRSQTTQSPVEDTNYSKRYRDMGRLPLLDHADLTSSAPPSHRAELDKAMAALERGDIRIAADTARRLINDTDEPAAEYVLGRALYRERQVAEAIDALMKAEAMSPPSAFRCWTALQMGLIIGDAAVIVRECQHLENSPQYREHAAQVLKEVERRG